MRYSKIACSLVLLLWAGAADAQNQPPVNIQQIADIMVRLCVGGGQTQDVTGAAGGGADISLRSLDVRGNLIGEFKINKSSAEGLVRGIDNALSQLAADQADKVRDCLKPVRDRLLDVMLPRPPLPPQYVAPSTLLPKSIWNHNGSTMSLSASGEEVKLYYLQPRLGMIGEGVKSGTLLFSGQISGDRVRGTAYLFDRRCAEGFSYQVSGNVMNGMRKIVMSGQAPTQFDFSSCQVIPGNYRPDTLVFDRID